MKHPSVHTLIQVVWVVTMLWPSMGQGASPLTEPARQSVAQPVFVPLAEIPKEDDPSAGRKAVSAGLAVVPGFFVHGMGHWIYGEQETALRLLAMEGVGVSLLIAGVLALATTGASDQFIVPSSVAAFSGAGLFLGSFFSDIYGVLNPSEGTGDPRTSTHYFEAVAGYQYVNNPSFSYQSFAHLGLEGRWSGLRVTPKVWIALDDDNWRLETDAAWRFLGPRPGHASEDGSYLELEGGYGYHAYTSDGFREHSFDLIFQGRYDMGRLGHTLKGSFFELGAGLGIQAYDRDFGAADGKTILLGGFAWGFYLGHGPQGWGEFALFYDHRHDGFAGGFKVPAVGSGVPGSFGLRLDAHIWDDFGLRTQLQVGSAVVATLNMVYRFGGGR